MAKIFFRIGKDREESKFKTKRGEKQAEACQPKLTGKAE
jgi:hypothetical protein